MVWLIGGIIVIAAALALLWRTSAPVSTTEHDPAHADADTAATEPDPAERD